MAPLMEVNLIQHKTILLHAIMAQTSHVGYQPNRKQEKKRLTLIKLSTLTRNYPEPYFPTTATLSEGIEMFTRAHFSMESPLQFKAVFCYLSVQIKIEADDEFCFEKMTAFHSQDN